MFVTSLRCESWRGFLSPVDSTKIGRIAPRAVDGTKSGWMHKEWVDRTMNRKDRKRERKTAG